MLRDAFVRRGQSSYQLRVHNREKKPSGVGGEVAPPHKPEKRSGSRSCTRKGSERENGNGKGKGCHARIINQKKGKFRTLYLRESHNTTVNGLMEPTKTRSTLSRGAEGLRRYRSPARTALTLQPSIPSHAGIPRYLSRRQGT